jgi:hypothetical protein
MAGDRCPHCRAGVPAGAAWCGLCFAPVGVGEMSAAPSGPVPAAAAAPTDNPPTAAPDPPACWPCARCRELVPVALDACPTCGAGFLEPLRERPNRRGRVVGRGPRLLAGLLAGLVAAAGLVLLLAAAG